MIVIDDYENTKRRVDDLRDRLSRAKGEQAAKDAELKRDFGVDSVLEARKLLKKLVKERERQTNLYLEKKKEFDQELEQAEEESK